MSRTPAQDIPTDVTRDSLFRRLFINRDVFHLWAGQIISQTGDSIFRIAMLWTLLELTGSNATTGLIAMSAYLPTLLFGIYSGAFVDRFDRRRTMLFADAARALIVLIIPLLYLFNGLNGVILGIAMFALASFNTLYLPARDTLVGQITDPHERLRANAMIQTSWMYAMLAGPAIAGVALSYTHAANLFSIDAMTFVVSFCFIYRIGTSKNKFRRLRFREFREAVSAGWADTKTGLGYVRTHRPLRVLLFITAINNLFLMGPAIIGAPIFVRQILNGGAEQYAFVQIAYAIGMLVTTFILHRYGGRFRNGHLVLWGIILDGLTLVPLFWVTTFWGMFVAMTIHALAFPLIIVARPTIVQNMVPQEMQGRIFSMISVAVFGLTAVSIAATGLIAEYIPMNVIYAASGLLAASTGALGWFFKDFRSLE
jgi:DHA3 family macrolide efflux protein-like MFS transporter